MVILLDVFTIFALQLVIMPPLNVASTVIIGAVIGIGVLKVTQHVVFMRNGILCRRLQMRNVYWTVLGSCHTWQFHILDNAWERVTYAKFRN